MMNVERGQALITAFHSCETPCYYLELFYKSNRLDFQYVHWHNKLTWDVTRKSL